MQAMNSGEVSRRELASIVADDPALAGGLLRLANSPIYRVSATPIESLDRAIALLGIEGMRSLISAALLQPVFRISGGSFPQFADVTWQHTLYAAHAAQAHATQAQASGIAHADPFAAQLLALVMGMGAIVVFRVAVDEYLAGTTPPHAGAVAGLIDTEAAPVGRQIALNWGLSTRMETALADQDAPPGSVLSALGRALRVGRFLAALALLREQQRIDDAAVQAALSSTGDPAAYAGIWSKLPFRS